MLNIDTIPSEARSEIVREATKRLESHLESTQYSIGNSIVPIRESRREILRDGELIKKLGKSGIRGKDLRIVVEEAAHQLGYERQTLALTTKRPLISGEIDYGRDNNVYWFRRAA